MIDYPQEIYKDLLHVIYEIYIYIHVADEVRGYKC